MPERTLAILKPDCVRRRLVGKVLQRLEEEGFHILAMRMMWLTQEQAEAFYSVHRGKEFFPGLVRFMTSGPCVVVALEKENAVADLRTLIGATDPSEAAPGTLRGDFGGSKTENIIHASDSPENGRWEVAFFFPEHELLIHRR